MAKCLVHLREDISKIDSLAGELRDNIYETDDNGEYYDIIDVLDELQDAITMLQEKQRWI